MNTSLASGRAAHARFRVFAAAVTGIAIFSAMDAVMKFLTLALDVYSVMFWRSLAGAAISGALYAWHRPPRPSRAALRVHAIRGAISAAMTLFFFWGLARVPMAEAIALTFIAPLLSLFVSAVVLKEHIAGRTIAASCIAVVGVIVIVSGQPRAEAGSDIRLGTIAILVSAVFYAFNITLMRRQALVAGPIEVAFAQSLVVAVLLAFGAPFLARVPDASLFAGIVGGAVLATAALLVLAWAYARAEASYLSTSEYTAFVWATLFGFVAFGERLTTATLLGAVLIVGGCAWGARQRPTALESPEATP
jgi:S-adenosylmethionine uptake transporter